MEAADAAGRDQDHALLALAAALQPAANTRWHVP
jgi:hypothetical protein